MEVFRTRKFYAIVTAVLMISIMSISAAFGAFPVPVQHKYVYVIKYVCNIPPSLEPAAPLAGLADGLYYVDINIYNPSIALKPSTLTMKYVPSPGPAGGAPIQFPAVVLAADSTMDIDCAKISGILYPMVIALPFKGFIILYSNTKLNVVAVYTAGTTLMGSLSVSINTQYIQSQVYIA
jgi:hypothetical protein